MARVRAARTCTSGPRATRAGWPAPRPRARARPSCRAADPATCCSRSAITTSRSGRTPIVAVGAERVRAWLDGYPALVGPYRDSDGRPPRHSFFFPGEEYQPGYLDALASLARRGLGEVELHLHHDGDTPDGLRAKIARVPAPLRRPRPPDAHAGRQAPLCVHPRQLVPRQRAPRRPLVRRRRRAAAAVRHRLLRGLHVPGGARSVAAADRQPDLLARRRSRAAPRAGRGRARPRGRCPARSDPDDRGAAGLRAAAGPAARAADRERGRHGRRPADARARPQLGPPGHPRRGAAGVGVRQGAHARRARKTGGGDAGRRRGRCCTPS